MDDEQLDNEYDNLSQEHLDLLHRDSDNVRLDNVIKRNTYIECI